MFEVSGMLDERNMKKFVSRVAVALCGACVVGVNAAPPLATLAPGATQQRTKQILEYYEQQQALEKLKSGQPQQESNIDNKTAQDGSKAPAKASQKFLLKQVEVGKSDILSDEEIAGITRKYVGKDVDIQTLFQMVAEINGLYKDKHYPTAKAVLPPQKVSQGVVQIKLVEARIGKVILENNASTKSGFIEDRVALRDGDLLSVDKLDADISRFNRINDVALRAEIRPGESFGTIDAVIRAQEPAQYQFSTFVDNAGSDSTGNNRMGLNFSDASLFGYRDPLAINGVFAEGSTDGSVSYSFPLTSYDTRLGMSYDKSAIEIIDEGALANADIAGESTVTTLNLVQPFIVSPNTKVEAFFAVAHKESETTFSGNDIANIKVHAYTVGASVLYVDEDGVWLVRNSFTDGHELEGDDAFNRYNGELTRMMRLDAGRSLTLRGAVQISGDDFLPSTEQFQVGGVATVRGYTEGLRIGDDGYYTSAELDFPLYTRWNDESSALFDNQVRGALFIDHGAAFPYKGNSLSTDSEDFLTAAGFGVVLGFDWGLTGRIDIGFPLAQRDDDSSDPKVGLLLQYNFF